MVWKGRNCWMAAAVAAALLIGSLTPAEAAGRRARSGTDLWAQLQVWLRAHVPGITALWGAEGTQIDPLGQPHAARPPATTSSGGGISVMWGAEGSMIDPLGQPHDGAAPTASTQADDGPIIDPSGGT
jgi:hypothetical protein